MDMPIVLKVCFALLALYFIFFCVGCVPLAETMRDIENNPSGYVQQSSGINLAFGDILPDGSKLPAGLLLGYGVAFLRRVYVNWIKSKNGKV